MASLRALGWNATWTELLQLVLSSGGLCLNLWALLDASRDAFALDAAFAGLRRRSAEPADMVQHDLRRIIATGNVQRELTRVLKQLVLLVVGVASVLLPPPHGNQPFDPWEALQLDLTRWSLILLTALMTADSLRERRGRRRFVRRMSAAHVRRDMDPTDGD